MSEKLKERATAISAIHSADPQSLANYAAELEHKIAALSRQASSLNRIGIFMQQHAQSWVSTSDSPERMNIADAVIMAVTRLMDRIAQADAGYEQVQRMDEVGQSRPAKITEHVMTVLMTDLLSHLTLKNQLTSPASALAYMVQWAHRRGLKIIASSAMPTVTVNPQPKTDRKQLAQVVKDVISEDGDEFSK